MRRWLITLPVILVVSLLAGIVQNNCCSSGVDRERLFNTREQAIRWMIENRELINNRHNLALWLMIKQAAEISGDKRLNTLHKDYIQRNFQALKRSPWLPYLTPLPSYDLKNFDLTEVPDYQLFFIYGVTCNENLAMTDVIRRQMDINYCIRNHPLSPACVSHQLLGYRQVHINACLASSVTDESIRKLAAIIKWQLFFDFRMVDVYIQRLLVLFDSDHAEMVNYRWVERYLDAQRDDGGWSRAWELVSLGPEKSLVQKKLRPRIQAPKSDFHATAQGLLLATFLLEEIENPARR